MEYFDIVDEYGNPTGETVSREAAHRDGVRHATAHVWVIREAAGRTQVLMQKRSEDKDSFPGKYDTSSAGHIPAGSKPLESALRELNEELGIRATADQLAYAGSFANHYEKEFYGKLFKDNEVTQVYVYQEPVDIGALKIQESELSEVRWFDMQEVWDEIQVTRERFCVPQRGLEVLMEFVKKQN